MPTVRYLSIAVLLLAACGLAAQSAAPAPSFEVATIKPVASDARTGRYIVMQDPHRFVGKDYTLKLLIAAAYELNPRAVSGGPAWMDSDHFDITAITPGDVRPNHDQQMAMLRSLLQDRFKLSFHREPKDFSLYRLEVAKNGPKLKKSTSAPDAPPQVISTVYPQRIVMPARNVSMADLVSVMQRAILDRPVVDKTGLGGRYDFDLVWAPDETQFGGDVGTAGDEAQVAPLFTAIQEQLGLRLVAARGPVSALVVDKAQKPSAD